MPTGTGLDGQLGIAEETTYGTYVAPTRFYEFTSEGPKADVRKIYGRGIGRGRFQRKDRIKTYVAGAAGQVALDVLTKGFGLWFKHLLGAVATTQPDAVGAPTVYLHTATPDTDGLRGKSLTVQAGRPSTNGTINPFNYEGSKVVAWELTCALDEALKLAVTLDAETEQTASALATPSYPANAALLTFVEGALTIGGATVDVSEVTLTGTNALNTNRRRLGNKKQEPLANAEWPITGQLAKDFENTTLYADFIAGTTAKLVLTFTGGIISGAFPFKLTVTLEAIEYTGETPVVEGEDVVAQSVPFKALSDGVNPVIKVEYQTTDSTP